MLQADAAAKATTPNFNMTIDGIHPDPVGHWLIASLIAAAFGDTPGLQVGAVIDGTTAAVISQTQTTVTDVQYQQDALPSRKRCRKSPSPCRWMHARR